MDIRTFFTKKRRVDSDLGISDQQRPPIDNSIGTFGPASIDNGGESRYDNISQGVSNTTTGLSSTETFTATETQSSVSDRSDIGLYINNAHIDQNLKLEIFENPYIPKDDYNYEIDGRHAGRLFRHLWLTDHCPWLVYSSVLKGPLCKFCVLFPQHVARGLQGSFIKQPCFKYKDFANAAKTHTQSSWHKNSVKDAKSFIKTMKSPSSSIISALNRNQESIIAANRLKIGSIVSMIVMCGVNDLALRGRHSNSGNFREFLDFRVEAGDQILKEHVETSNHNSSYTSVRLENEIIESCEDLLCNDIVNEANKSDGFSVLADETADVAGIEQLSVGVRYTVGDSDKQSIREEFIGYVDLETCDAESIATTIMNKMQSTGLNLTKLVGQGYDGCSTMAGHVAGV